MRLKFEEVIIPIVVGGPWPARRQVWRVVHHPEGHTLLVTDGLSDFFVAQAKPSVGFGVELALETDEPLGNVEKSWPLLLLERVGDEVAEHERGREHQSYRPGFTSGARQVVHVEVAAPYIGPGMDPRRVRG